MEFLEAHNQGAWNWFQARRGPWLDGGAVAFSFLGNPLVLVVLVLLVVAVLTWYGQARTARRIGLTVAGGLLLLWLVQGVVNREPPEVTRRPLEAPGQSSSFPSGHAFLAAVTYFTLALVARDFLRGRRVREVVLPAAGLLVLLIGASRLLIGTCYPSDVLAGWLGGTALALLGWGLQSGKRGE